MADLTLYWQQRAERFGPRAVFNLKHPENRLNEVTGFQRNTILPLIRPLLRGDEQHALDFGCGTGRFTADLARLIGGSALGIDPTLPLINEATPADDVRFVHAPDGRVPAASRSMDLVFVSLVLGGLRGALLGRAVGEITRVLKRDGLLVLIENTSDQPDAEHWVFRGIDEYQKLFPTIKLKHLDDYDEVGERISILAGRPRAEASS